MAATLERFREIISTYGRHGWRLACVLVRPETRNDLKEAEAELFGEAIVREDSLDALWFKRPSHAGREAWELRAVAEAPYALFETFEVDEAEEEREEVRREMEARLRERNRAS